MLIIGCCENEKDCLRSDVLGYFADYPGVSFEVEEFTDGWVIRGFYNTNVSELGTLEINHEVFLEELMCTHPELSVKGSLEFGDDNFRNWYWFMSEAGSTEIEWERCDFDTDEETNDSILLSEEFFDRGNRDSMGAYDNKLRTPLQLDNAWKTVEIQHDYGTDYLVFYTQEDFITALKVFVGWCEGKEMSEDDYEEIMLDIIGDIRGCAAELIDAIDVSDLGQDDKNAIAMAKDILLSFCSETELTYEVY